ncbi:hypothetical protein [Aliarcobacter butzleri]|uniref:hypothetical protein n=1 Tax=Aliarcobacter butzleri TaxID=28197 RepID=UPI0021B64C9C|nr:hypothetical protein [Aliarcobacter butzleri]MCT7643873.1 hypothetical protein [Aliarcobacter butzleri]
MNKLEIFNDDEFKSLDTEKKNQVLTNYFNTNLADDDYKSLDSEKQNSILQNFISSQLTSDKELKSEELPKKDKSFIDKAKEFGKNYVDDVADTFIGARPFGTEDKAKDLKDKAFEKVFGGLGGVQETKSLDLKLENKEDAQLQEKLKATLDNKNDEKIDDSLIRSIEGLARTDIRLIGEATSEQKNDYLKNVAGILGKGGYALGQNDKGEYIAVDKQGNEKSITNDFFGSILDTVVADAGEISGAMYGAKKGLEVSKNIKNPLLKAGAVATSSAMGAMTGTALDTAINELRGNQSLGVADYLNEMSKSAVLDAVGSAVGYGIVKVGGKIVELPKQARDYIVNGNLNGAREILKKDLKIDEEFIEDALQQAQNSYKEVGEYANKGLTDKSRQQEELLAATLEKGDANIIKGAISTNETAARNLADTIDKRATNIYEELEKKSSKVGGEEIKNYLNNFENTTKQNFSNMRKDFDEAFKEVDYKFELEDLGLNSVFKDMSKRVQDPDAKQRFLTLQTAIKNTIYDSNAQIGIERDINGLLDLRQQLNKFYGQNERYLANKKDKDTFNSLKENIDNQIYKAVNDNLPEEVGTRLIDSFSKSMQGYRELGTLQDNKVFNGIMGEAKNPEFRMDNLVKHMADDDSYVDDVLSKMTPNARQTVEVAVIRDITDSFTAKTAQGQKAIAFEDLGKKLQSIKRNVRSELGKETIDNLIAYADKFGNKDLLYLDMAKGIATKPKHNISTTLEGKIKMETASMLFQIVQTLKPGDDAKRLALQRHIGQALEKSRTPNEFATNMYEYPDLTDDSRQILKTLIKNNNKVLAAKNNEEAEAILKQAEVENNKIFEEQNKLKEQIENFKTPDIYEIKTVAGLTLDDRFGSFSQMTTKIQNGTATQAEIEQYLKAKNKIEPEALEKNILKLKYPENAFSVHKLKELKELNNEKVNEIINENEFKTLIYNLDKHNHLPNTTTKMENKYRENFYKLNKLYDEEKQALKQKEELSFEEMDKQGLIPFANGEILGGAFFGGSEAAFSERDYNNDGANDIEDIAIGAIGGAIGFKALSKMFPNWFKNDDIGINANKLNKEKKNILKVAQGEKPSTVLRKYDENEIINLSKGYHNQETNKGAGLEHILVRHMKDDSNGKISLEELTQIGEVIRNGELTINNNKRVYTLNKDDVRFRAITGENENAEKVISFYSNRNINSTGLEHNAQNYTLSTNADDGIIITYKPQKSFKEWVESLEKNDDGIVIGAFGGKSPVVEKDFKDAQGFYSVLEKVVDEKVGGKIDSVSLTKLLENNGAKQDELEWSGLKDLLDSKEKLTKKEIEETLTENRLVLEKVEKEDYLGKASKLTKQLEEISKQPETKENTKEFNKILKERDDLEKKHISTDTSTKYSNYILDGGENYREILFRTPTNEKGYKSDHWKESNIIVFTRVDDRKIDDKKTLFIEELQSDWHQEGRKKGYGNKKVPDAPFKKNWSELGLKRMIQEAVENDYEKIAWTTGKQQTQRYSLEKEIDTVIYNKESGYLQASKDGDEVIFKKVANDEEVSTLLGKELTTRLIDPKHSTRDNIFVIKGEETKFGGDGMKTFYDEIVPNTAKKLLKKYNVKPKLEELDEIEEMVWSIEITPKMKEDIKKYGQPLYAVGGAIAIGTTQEVEAGNLHEEQDKLYGDIK